MLEGKKGQGPVKLPDWHVIAWCELGFVYLPGWKWNEDGRMGVGAAFYVRGSGWTCQSFEQSLLPTPHPRLMTGVSTGAFSSSYRQLFEVPPACFPFDGHLCPSGYFTSNICRALGYSRKGAGFRGTQSESLCVSETRISHQCNAGNAFPVAQGGCARTVLAQPFGFGVHSPSTSLGGLLSLFFPTSSKIASSKKPP